MYKSNSSRIFPLILIIIVVIALIAGVITIGRYMFAGNNDKKQEQSQEKTARDELLTVAEGRSVRMTIRGPIVANEEFRSHRIVVSPSQRTYKVYSGYLGEVKGDRVFGNNLKAYEEFVYALDKAAMTKPGKQKPDEVKDVRGICATGRVYEYEILDGGEPTARYWTSTCKGSPGSFGASVEQVTNLFSAQIPSDVELDFGSSSSGSRLRF